MLLDVKILSKGQVIDDITMDETGRFMVNTEYYMLAEHSMEIVYINGVEVLLNYDGYNEIVKMMVVKAADEKTKEIEKIFMELRYEDEVFDPVEIEQFTFEAGYYSCKRSMGLSLDKYDRTRLIEITKVLDEVNENKFKR